MVFIPAGEFTMGSYSGDDDEKPEREVFLDAFCMDKYEVSNAQYKECVDAGACNPPTCAAPLRPNTKTKHIKKHSFLHIIYLLIK